MNEEIKEKLEKLKEYEAQERTQKRWQPYKEMKKELLHMYDCKKHLCEAAHFQDVAEEICSDYGLELYTNGTACMWDALEELEKQIGAKEKEFEELYSRLKEEE